MYAIRSYYVPWLKVNFIGAAATSKSLRRIGEYYEDEDLKARIEKVIAEEEAKLNEKLALIKPKTEGKTTMLFVGASRAHVITSYSIHYTKLYDLNDRIENPDKIIEIAKSLGAKATKRVLINGDLIFTEEYFSKSGSVITSYSIHYTKLYDFITMYTTGFTNSFIR